MAAPILTQGARLPCVVSSVSNELAKEGLAPKTLATEFRSLSEDASDGTATVPKSYLARTAARDDAAKNAAASKVKMIRRNVTGLGGVEQ